MTNTVSFPDFTEWNFLDLQQYAFIWIKMIFNTLGEKIVFYNITDNIEFIRSKILIYHCINIKVSIWNNNVKKRNYYLV